MTDTEQAMTLAQALAQFADDCWDVLRARADELETP